MSSTSFAGIIRFVPAFLTGILLSTFVDIDISSSLLFLVFLLLLLYINRLIIPSKYHYSLRWLIGSFIHLPVLISGLLLTSLQKEINYPDHFSKLKTDSLLTCIVNEAPIVKGKNIRFEAIVKEVKQGNSWHNTKGKLLIYLRIDSLIVKPNYGDLLILRKIPLKLSPPLNPGTFDFQKWLNRREIYHQVFLMHDDYLIVGKNKGNTLLALAITWRNYLLNAIRDAGILGQEEAVLSALILGQDDEIDPELRNSYSTAGVMHILAVSGMHVGLIYGALCLLLRFPGKSRRLNLFKMTFLIICLWFYAMLTGLSPSVLRAAMMLSFLVVGTGLRRNANAMNILAASAIALFLVFSPSLIFSAGFQLSFFAVMGILFLYKPLSNIFTPRSWLGTRVWSIVAVSIVAQVATFPLSIYYFHRFPNYFLISNLIVIPLGTLTIFGGIIVLFLSWCPPLAISLGKLLSMMIHFLNESVMFLGELPGSSTNGIYFSLEAMILLYIGIFLFSLFLLMKRSLYLVYASAVFSIVFCFHIYRSWNTMYQKFVLVGHSYRHSYVQFFKGQRVISFCDSLMSADTKLRMRVSEGYFLERAIKVESIVSLVNRDSIARSLDGVLMKLPFVEFNGQRFYFLSAADQITKPTSTYIDYVIVNGNPKFDISEFLAGINCKNVIADASNAAWRIREWKKYCDQKSINFIDISKTGAFRINME